jgi:hypothetical protein
MRIFLYGTAVYSQEYKATLKLIGWFANKQEAECFRLQEAIKSGKQFNIDCDRKEILDPGYKSEIPKKYYTTFATITDPGHRGFKTITTPKPYYSMTDEVLHISKLFPGKMTYFRASAIGEKEYIAALNTSEVFRIKVVKTVCGGYTYQFFRFGTDVTDQIKVYGSPVKIFEDFLSMHPTIQECDGMYRDKQ